MELKTIKKSEQEFEAIISYSTIGDGHGYSANYAGFYKGHVLHTGSINSNFGNSPAEKDLDDIIRTTKEKMSSSKRYLGLKEPEGV